MDLNDRTPSLRDEGIAEVLAAVKSTAAAEQRVYVQGDGARDDLDATPPPDHEGFLEARALGLRAIREKLARRRRVR